MAGNPIALAWAEDGHHVVRHPDADIQQLAFAGHIVVRHSGLDHMAGAVHLMLVHVVPTLVQASQSVERVDITILLLRRGELVNPLVALGLKHWIGIVLERISHALERLVHIGVIEKYSGMLTLAFRRVLEIADSAGLVLNLVNAHIESHILMALKPGGPESVIDLDL